MTFALRTLSFAALAVLTFAAAPSFAEDAMAPADAMATDAMAPADAMATDAMAPAAMTPISDADFAMCKEQASAITFEGAMAAAMAGCAGMHKGMDVMGTIQAMQVQMQDAMAPADEMAPAAQ